MKETFRKPGYLRLKSIGLWLLMLLTTVPAYGLTFDTLDSAGNQLSSKKVIAEEPDRYIQNMEQYLRQGKLDLILSLAQTMSSMQVDDPRIPALYSIALVSQGDLVSAKKKIEQAKKSGETRYVSYAQAMILKKENKYDQAEKECMRAIEKYKDHPYPWNILGRIRFDRGNYKKAYESFQKAVELEPLFLPGHINLGAAAFTMGDNETSLHHFKKALDVDPRSPKTHLGLGLVYKQMGNFSQAANHFKRVVEIAPGNKTALTELGRAQLKSMQYQDAMRTGKKMMENELPEAGLIMGKAALHLGKAEKAVAYLEKADPENESVRTWLVFSYMIQERYEKALALTGKILSKNPDNFGAFLARAGLKYLMEKTIDVDKDLRTGWGESLDKAVFFSRGCVFASGENWKKAAENWKKAKNLIPGFSVDGLDAKTFSQGLVPAELPLVNLGVIYYYNNMYAYAAEQFKMAKKKNSGSIFSNYWAAQVMLKQGNRNKALTFLENSLEHAPNFFTALYTIAELHLLEGDSQKSLDYYKKALEVKKDPGILLKLGLFHDNADQVSKAESYYQTLINEKPGFYIGYNQLAWLYAKRGIRLEKALKLAEKANELRPGNASTLDTIGWIFYHKADYDKAIEYLKESEKINPNNPSVVYHLGFTYHKAGEKNKAFEYLENALKMNRGVEDAEKAKEILRDKG